MKLMKRWNILNSRIVAFYQQGWYSVAAALAEETVEFAEKAFGSDHPNVAESLNNLALIYYTQGKETEASVFEHSLTQHQGKELEPNRSDTSQFVNKVVLLNLAKRKYSLAEPLFRRALEIKKSALGQEHSELLQVLGNLADLHNTQGKYAEAESSLKALRVRDTPVYQDIQTAEVEQDSQDFKERRYNREYMRCNGRFRAKLANAETGVSISGVTENISQVGTFIKTDNWRAFRTNDQVSVAISLPSILSDQMGTIDMEGPGIIARIDEEDEGIAIQFMRSFKQFKRLEETEVAGKIRYKRLTDYLTDLGEASLTYFSNTYPKGFLVEKSRMDFNSDVIFQFSTEEISLPNTLKKLPNEVADTSFFETRVVEISKKRIDTNEGIINIGRSASNDIVLYNKTVSKTHAFMYFSSNDGSAHIADLQSTNCTFINNEKIAPYAMYKLADGCEISFGPQTKVIFLSTEVFYDFLTSLKRSNDSKMHS